jgi:hypothetical protein
MNNSAPSQNGGYLFATFKDEATTHTEQIYFGLSTNGCDWTALNGGEPVLVSKLGEIHSWRARAMARNAGASRRTYPSTLTPIGAVP